MIQGGFRGLTAVLIAVLLPASHVVAQAVQLVRPGVWQITPEGSGSASVGYQLCFKTGSLDDVKLLLPNLTAPADCPPVKLSADGGQLTWQFDCPAHAVKASAHYALSADAINGTFLLERGAPAVKSGQTIKARHHGACEP